MSLISPIEQHVAAVRRKMILQHFVRSFAVALLAVGGVAWGTALALRLFALELPGGGWAWLVLGVALAGMVALAWAVHRAPTPHEAALAIDERLGLKEKFSTALAVAHEGDPFAQLAVKDATRAAGRVDLKRKFPLSWPKTLYGVPAWALLILLTLWLVPSLKWAQTADAGANADVKAAEKVQAEAEKIIQQTTTALAALPQEVAEREEFRVAADRLAEAREALSREPAQARQTAKEAQQELAEALKNQIERGEDYAQAKENAKAFRSMTPPTDATGPVAEAHRAMANADYKQAMEELAEAVDNFEKMTKEEQAKQAEQMQQLASALQQMANDPQQQQQQQQQLQEMGLNKEQAQQAQKQLEKAAQGDPQAAQQLQQMAQAAMQQMNNGQGPNPQQQAQMQQMMQSLQQQAGSQAMSQQMQQMAQQMAQAMQQQAQQGQQGQQQQQQSQGQGQQQASSQGQGQGQSAAGQGGGQQSAGGGGNMQGASQQMQDMLAQMQAVQQNAQQMQAAQQGMGGAGEGQGQGQGQGPPSQNGAGQWKAGDPQGQGGGMGGPGQGAGGQAQIAPAPFAFTPQTSKSHDDEAGRVVASTLIKAEALKGESKAEVQRIVESETKEATDEVDQQRVSRQAQKAVREYFQSMAKDAGAAPPAAGASDKPAEKPTEKPAGNP